MAAPLWALTTAYWLHMLATVLWIGGLAVLTILVLPTAQKNLDQGSYAAFLAALQKRLDPLAWFSIIVLAASGMIQMSSNPNYQGVLNIQNLWAGAILVKHILFGLMLLLSGLVTWGVLPALRRAALLETKGLETPNAAVLQQRQKWLLRANLALGVLVLLLTALARSA